MNKIILTLAIIATSFSLSGYGQCPVALSELEKISSYTSSDFETYILKRGFSLWRQKSERFTIQQYWCDKKNPNGRRDQIGRTSGSGISTIVEFTTTDKLYYLDFKNKLVTSGYKLDREAPQALSDDVTTLFYYYSNDAYVVTIYSYDVFGITTYGHQLYRKN